MATIKDAPIGRASARLLRTLQKDLKQSILSLSIIMKMAKDVKYTTAFGANNLIVRI